MNRTFRPTMMAVLAVGLLAASCSGQGDEEQTASSSATSSASVATTTQPPTAAEASADAPAEGTDTETDTETGTATDTETGTDAESRQAVALGCPGLTAGLNQLELEVQGVSYDVRIHVPEAYEGSPDAPAPVVINWHGLGSDGFQQATYSAYETLADTEGFLTVHPTGPPIPGSDQNAWDLGLLTTEQMTDLGVDPGDRDDLAMAGELIDALVADWCVDPGRVYSTGLSNGGFFTGRLICEIGDRIAAAVAVAGLTHPDDCDPSAAVPLLAYHGTDDAVVPYEGGGDRELPPQAPPEVAALFDQTIFDEFAQFAATFGCAADPVVDNQSAEVTAYRYEGCDSNRFAITLFEIDGGGHTWPGSALGLVLAPLLGETTYDVDATIDGWAYMSQFSR